MWRAIWPLVEHGASCLCRHDHCEGLARRAAAFSAGVTNANAMHTATRARVNTVTGNVGAVFCGAAEIRVLSHWCQVLARRATLGRSNPEGIPRPGPGSPPARSCPPNCRRCRALRERRELRCEMREQLFALAHDRFELLFEAFAQRAPDQRGAGGDLRLFLRRSERACSASTRRLLCSSRTRPAPSSST